MLHVEKIINAGNCQLVLKWSDGVLQTLSAPLMQSRCACVNCACLVKKVEPDVTILSWQIKGRLGIKVQFSSGCKSGIYSFNQIRSWLENF